MTTSEDTQGGTFTREPFDMDAVTTAEFSAEICDIEPEPLTAFGAAHIAALITTQDY